MVSRVKVEVFLRKRNFRKFQIVPMELFPKFWSKGKLLITTAAAIVIAAVPVVVVPVKACIVEATCICHLCEHPHCGQVLSAHPDPCVYVPSLCLCSRSPVGPSSLVLPVFLKPYPVLLQPSQLHLYARYHFTRVIAVIAVITFTFGV